MRIDVLEVFYYDQHYIYDDNFLDSVAMAKHDVI